jgi:hypothetical protein
VAAGAGRSTAGWGSKSSPWRYGIRNGFGVTVEAQQILAAGEKRTADAQQALAELAAQVAHLRSAGVDDNAIRQAVDDELDTAVP